MYGVSAAHNACYNFHNEIVQPTETHKHSQGCDTNKTSKYIEPIGSM